jgi:hypothetical protein
MATAVIYVLVLTLLILSSVMLFRQALQLLRRPVSKGDRVARQPAALIEEVSNDKTEIIERLERQFRSSPSIDL